GVPLCSVRAGHGPKPRPGLSRPVPPPTYACPCHTSQPPAAEGRRRGPGRSGWGRAGGPGRGPKVPGGSVAGTGRVTGGGEGRPAWERGGAPPEKAAAPRPARTGRRLFAVLPSGLPVLLARSFFSPGRRLRPCGVVPRTCRSPDLA